MSKFPCANPTYCDEPYFDEIWNTEFCGSSQACTRVVDETNSPMIPYYKKNGITPPVRPYYLRKYLHHHPKGWRRLYPPSGPNYADCIAWSALRSPLLNPAKYYINRTYEEELALAIATRKFYEFADSLDIHLGVSLGEAPKTFGMIADTMVSFYHAFKSFKRLDVRGGLSALGMPTGGGHARSLYRKANNAKKASVDTAQFMGNTWLEVKYGWKPLIQEVQSAAEALTKDFSKDYDVRIRTKGKKEYSLPVPPYGGASGSGWAKAYIGAHFLIFDPTLRLRSNLGLTEVASIAWEVMPWSFVIDWFSPIGDYIAAGSALEGLQFIDGYETTVTDIDFKAYRTQISSTYDCDFQERLQFYKLRRTKLASAPSTTRILNSKDFSKLINLDKCVTSLALLQSVVRR